METNLILITRLVGVLLWLSGFAVMAQDNPRYLVLFQDKNGTPYSIEQPQTYLSERAIERRARQGIAVTETDLPVNPDYVAEVRKTGAYIFYPTKWFNGVVVSATDQQLQAIRELPFYKGIEKDMPLANSDYIGRLQQSGERVEEIHTTDYGNSKLQLEMLGVSELHSRGFTGNGILIGVMDAGFFGADEQPYLAHLFESGKVTDTYDFISGDHDVYDDHKHGLEVLSVMASRWEGRMVGPAYDAHYALYRTENTFSETPYEEVAWLLAAERADSLGVDIINTSLGYYDFENPVYNYSYDQMDGKTTIISKAARQAARTGILVVVSAGNEGSNAWKYITAPADVDSVLTVGAVFTSGRKYPLSSFGPNAEGTIKPDVVALGSGVAVGSTSGTVISSSGTSFASPLVASFAALLWQVHPGKTAQEIAELIRMSGNQAETPDTAMGYGIPYYGELVHIAGPEEFEIVLEENRVHFSWSEVPGEIVTVYEIERSFNGGQFEMIASIPGNRYSEDVLTGPGDYRYRIRGVAGYRYGQYSETRSIAFIVTGREEVSRPLRLWPNPADDKIFVDFNPFIQNQTVIAEVFNVTGNVRITCELFVSVDGIAEIRVGMLPAGLYLLRLATSAGEVYVRKFLKK